MSASTETPPGSADREVLRRTSRALKRHGVPVELRAPLRVLLYLLRAADFERARAAVEADASAAESMRRAFELLRGDHGFAALFWKLNRQLR